MAITSPSPQPAGCCPGADSGRTVASSYPPPPRSIATGCKACSPAATTAAWQSVESLAAQQLHVHACGFTALPVAGIGTPDEKGDRTRHRQLGAPAARETVLVAVALHVSAMLERPHGCDDGAVLCFPSQGLRMGVAEHHRQKPCLGHTSG